MTSQEKYKAYLKRYIRTTGESMKEASSKKLCKEVAKEYGLSVEELKELETELS